MRSPHSHLAENDSDTKERGGKVRLDSFGLYLQEISKTPTLSAQEEKDLAYQIAEGDVQARDRMIRANLRLVVNVARSYAGKGLSLADLVEEGNLGLIRATEGFDPSMNTRFSTYAVYWIRQSIKRGIMNTGKSIRIPPAYMVQLLSKWRQAAAALQEELDRAPTHEEIAKCIKVPKKKLALIKKAIRIYEAPPESDHQADGGLSIEEMIMDSKALPPDSGMISAEELQQLEELLEKLDKREATIFCMRYGLDDNEPATLKEIGEQIGLTRERVRQIGAETMDKVRREIVADEEGEKPRKELALSQTKVELMDLITSPEEEVDPSLPAEVQALINEPKKRRPRKIRTNGVLQPAFQETTPSADASTLSPIVPPADFAEPDSEIIFTLLTDPPMATAEKLPYFSGKEARTGYVFTIADKLSWVLDEHSGAQLLQFLSDLAAEKNVDVFLLQRSVREYLTRNGIEANNDTVAYIATHAAGISTKMRSWLQQLEKGKLKMKKIKSPGPAEELGADDEDPIEDEADIEEEESASANGHETFLSDTDGLFSVLAKAEQIRQDCLEKTRRAVHQHLTHPRMREAVDGLRAIFPKKVVQKAMESGYIQQKNGETDMIDIAIDIALQKQDIYDHMTEAVEDKQAEVIVTIRILNRQTERRLIPVMQEVLNGDGHCSDGEEKIIADAQDALKKLRDSLRETMYEAADILAGTVPAAGTDGFFYITDNEGITRYGTVSAWGAKLLSHNHAIDIPTLKSRLSSHAAIHGKVGSAERPFYSEKAVMEGYDAAEMH